jgi:hypothetical protein
MDDFEQKSWLDIDVVVIKNVGLTCKAMQAAQI